MNAAKVLLFFLFLICLFYFLLPHQVNANSLIIRNDSLFLIESNASISELRTQGIMPESLSRVLGTTSGVSAVVTVSLFAPTSTPTPTNSPTPTNTPTPTPTSQPGTNNPTSTPTPTPSPTPRSIHSPSPAPDNNNSGELIVRLDNGNTTIEERVTELVLEDDGGNTLITITPDEAGRSMIIDQNGVTATTSLQIEINQDKKSLSVLTENERKVDILLPGDALKNIAEKGSYIIPESIQMTLVEERGGIVYIVTGKEKAEIIRLFFWDFPVSITVSATTGEILSSRSSFVLIILEFLNIARRVLQ